MGNEGELRASGVWQVGCGREGETKGARAGARLDGCAVEASRKQKESGEGS